MDETKSKILNQPTGEKICTLISKTIHHTRLKSKDDLLNEKMTIVSQFEKKLAELTSDLTIVQNENGRMKEDEKVGWIF